jgi:hypothetical protein
MNQQPDRSYLDPLVQAVIEDVPDKDADILALDAILDAHEVSGEAREEIKQWLKAFTWNETSRSLRGMVESSERRIDESSERFHRLNSVLGYYSVPFLKAALNRIDGGPRGTRWRSAKSEELMRAADSIVLGSDEVMKDKLIAVCKTLDGQGCTIQRKRRHQRSATVVPVKAKAAGYGERRRTMRTRKQNNQT